LTTQKKDGSKISLLIPIDCEIFDCCASYIKEKFDDWYKVLESDTPPQCIADAESGINQFQPLYVMITVLLMDNLI
jgi:hypothetical protein